jgi:hypothetical protein
MSVVVGWGAGVAINFWREAEAIITFSHFTQTTTLTQIKHTKIIVQTFVLMNSASSKIKYTICAIMTLMVIARHGRSVAFNAARLQIHILRRSSMRPTSPYLLTRSSSHIHNQCYWNRRTPLFVSMTWTDDEEAIGTLPYSTTSSAPAKPATKAATASSTLPFSAPRNSFDDSLPSGKGGSGISEWSKLGLLTELVDALTSPSLGLMEGPTPVQKMAIPEILSGCKERMASVEGVRKTKVVEKKSDFDVDFDGRKSEAEDGDIPAVGSVAFAAATGE